MYIAVLSGILIHGIPFKVREVEAAGKAETGIV